MPIGRPLKELVLTPDEQAKLELMARRPKTDQRTAQRARIVLDCAAGLSNTAVAAQRRVTLPTVGKWRQRFLNGRLGALGDAPRSGQPQPPPKPFVWTATAELIFDRVGSLCKQTNNSLH